LIFLREKATRVNCTFNFKKPHNWREERDDFGFDGKDFWRIFIFGTLSKLFVQGDICKSYAKVLI
jgi:hypothetical protein